MSKTTVKPVIFLAFTNDRDETVGYLRKLLDEARRMQERFRARLEARAV